MNQDMAFMTEVTGSRRCGGRTRATDTGRRSGSRNKELARPPKWRPANADSGQSWASPVRDPHRPASEDTAVTAGCHRRALLVVIRRRHILADNDYQPVSQPRPGDLVVYREGPRITHSRSDGAADGPVWSKASGAGWAHSCTRRTARAMADSLPTTGPAADATGAGLGGHPARRPVRRTYRC